MTPRPHESVYAGLAFLIIASPDFSVVYPPLSGWFTHPEEYATGDLRSFSDY